VDTVFIAGRKVKEGGYLLYPASDLDRKKEQLADSGQRIFRDGGISEFSSRIED